MDWAQLSEAPRVVTHGEEFESRRRVFNADVDISPAAFIDCHEVGDVQRAVNYCREAGVALSTQEQGLLPISQHSLFVLASLAYHDYEGVALNEDEKPRLVADMGDKMAMILRNHGLLTAGPTIADAFQAMYFLEVSCQIQLAAQSTGNAMTMIAPEILAGIRAQAKEVQRGMGGQLVWPGLLRKLDRRDPSYRD